MAQNAPLPQVVCIFNQQFKSGQAFKSPCEVARGQDWYGRTEIAPAACNAHARLEAKREGWHASVQRWAVSPSVRLVYRTYEESHRMPPLAWKSCVKKNPLCRLLIHTPAGDQPAPLGAKAARSHCNSNIHTLGQVPTEPCSFRLGQTILRA